jgi:hypothetical protein
VGLAATVLPVLGSGQASADYAPQSGDVVGVGGDTPQYAVDFLINGDTGGDIGFDASTGVNRVVHFDATADANGRQAYAPGSTEKTPIYLNPTVVLRAGLSPVQRPQSSSAALAALYADKSTPETINYVASASAPATGNGVTGGLDYVKFATDSIQIAVDKALTDAPAGLSALQLANIYDGTWTYWAEVANNSSAAQYQTGPQVIPEIPPSSSSVYSNFVKALTAVDSGFTVDSSVVQTVEQNDPTAITGASSPADAIVPFSAGRLNLWNGTAGTANKGYFHDPATVFPGNSTPLSPGVSLLSGTPSDSNPVLNIAISDYIVWRAADTTVTNSPYQPGGTLNWVQTLFYDPTGPTPYIDSPEGQALIAAAGVTPTYQFFSIGS